MSHEVIPEYRHMVDIIQRGPATGPEVDAVNEAIRQIEPMVRDAPEASKRWYEIEVTRNGLHVYTISLAPTIEEYARLRFDEACLDYWDCAVSLIETEYDVSDILPGRVDMTTLILYRPQPRKE